MRLIRRIGALWQADMHGILDSLEDPTLTYKQAIREIEQLLDEKRTELERVSREREILTRHEESLAGHQRDAHAQLSLALEEGREQLARSCMERRLTAEKQLTQLGKRMEQIAADADSLRGAIDIQNRKLQELKTQYAVVAPAPVFSSSQRDEGLWVSAEEVELALLAEKRKRAGAKDPQGNQEAA